MQISEAKVREAADYVYSLTEAERSELAELVADGTDATSAVVRHALRALRRYRSITARNFAPLVSFLTTAYGSSDGTRPTLPMGASDADIAAVKPHSGSNEVAFQDIEVIREDSGRKVMPDEHNAEAV